MRRQPFCASHRTDLPCRTQFEPIFLRREAYYAESETDILAEGTVSSELLRALKEYAEKTGKFYAFQRGKGGTEHYTLGEQTATLKVHVSAENKATLILNKNDLQMDWWKGMTDEILKPADTVVE